jgi:hypothetical protein
MIPIWGAGGCLVNRAAPPENKRGAGSRPTPQRLSGDVNIAGQIAPIKRLLGNHGETWLFEVLAGQNLAPSSIFHPKDIRAADLYGR